MGKPNKYCKCGCGIRVSALRVEYVRRHRPHTSLATRFWKKVDKNGPVHPVCGQCWTWTGYTCKTTGYGQISGEGRREDRELLGSHRVSWLIHNGEIKEGVWILHKCDNRKCVNPDHLFIGTQQENINDAVKKWRVPYGPEHWNFKHGKYAKVYDKRNLLLANRRRGESGGT